MPLNRISQDSEASNAPESLKTTKALEIDAGNAILKFKKQNKTKFWIRGIKKKKMMIERSLIQGARGKYPPSPVNSLFCAVLSLILSRP